MEGSFHEITRYRYAARDQESYRDIQAGAGNTRRQLAASVVEPGSLPPAPHIQCCDELTLQREEKDRRGPDGEMPDWAAPVAGKDGTAYPRPPWVSVSRAEVCKWCASAVANGAQKETSAEGWESQAMRSALFFAALFQGCPALFSRLSRHCMQIRGLPRDNLPLTHVAQADIWAHQFPADNCREESTRFLISWWDRPNSHGLGSQLHLMTEMLGMAMSSGRVLVFLPKSFDRAKHSGCRGMGATCCPLASLHRSRHPLVSTRLARQPAPTPAPAPEHARGSQEQHISLRLHLPLHLNAPDPPRATT